MQSDRAVLGISWLNKEVFVSRLLAIVVAACLLAVATTEVLDPDAVHGSHPRNWLVAVVCTLLGLRIVAHANRNAVGWLLLVMGVCSALAVGTDAWSAEFVPAWLSTWVWWPTYALLPAAVLLFPTGRLPSRRWLAVLVAAALGVVLPMIGIGLASWQAPATFWADAVNGKAAHGQASGIAAVGFLCLVVGLLGAVTSLVVRWRRAGQDERRLLTWSVICTPMLIPALFLEMINSGWGAWAVFAAVFPVSTLIAILWYGLYDIALLVHRSVLFGLLATVLAAAYTVTVLAFTAPLPTHAHVIGTVAVVLLLAPLYRRLRAGVDRWLYGDRDDPYRALSRLGEQLENLLRPDEVFEAVARCVGNALKVPYVAIQGQPPHRLLATYGVSRRWPQLTVPLGYDGNNVGDLIVEARSPEENIGRRERRLLVDLARQVALAARSVRLARELQRANEERVEDLRRITGEMHDKVAPGVAAVGLQVDALRTSMGNADARVTRKLGQIVDALASVSKQIRQLVRAVRPRDLHLGLLEALRRRADQFETPDLTVTVTPTGVFEQLPATVEDEAFGIVSAALSNVAQHADASNCEIKLIRTTDQLEINVIDDGAGIPPDVTPGIGLESMRHRCESRSGSFRIERHAQGTTIVAVLPISASRGNTWVLE